jgi:hypothetical protein
MCADLGGGWRGRSYPAITTAIGERVGLVGALRASRRRRATTRDVDGVVIADGFWLTTPALKPTDNLSMLVARVGTCPKVAVS